MSSDRSKVVQSKRIEKEEEELNRSRMQGNEQPAVLAIGTQVSTKYK